MTYTVNTYVGVQRVQPRNIVLTQAQLVIGRRCWDVRLAWRFPRYKVQLKEGIQQKAQLSLTHIPFTGAVPQVSICCVGREEVQHMDPGILNGKTTAQRGQMYHESRTHVTQWRRHP